MTSRPAGTKRKLRALIVEDDEDDCFFLRRELERSGFDVDWARVDTGPAMRASLDAQVWDVVLSDFRMPTFSAPEALATLKATGKDIPFIIVSGTIGEETAVDALKSGAHDFLVKGRLSRLAPAIERELRDVATRRERAEAEQRLRESEARFRRIIETSQEGIWTMDAKAQTTFVNRQMVEMLGLTRDEMQSRPVMSFVVESDRAALGACLERLQQGTPERLELRFRRADASEFWASLSTSPIIGDDGELVGALAMVTDVTEQRKIQAQLLVADRMVSVGILAAGVAHEINNPLTAVMANIDLAKLVLEHDVLDEAARAEVKSELDDAREAANRVREIVRDLKMFSRGPQNEDAREPVDLQRVLDSCLRMAHNEIRHRARVVRVIERVPAVLANEARIGQVFLNLLVNAAQAMDEGKADQNEIRVRTYTAPNGQVVTELADTGVGMSQETLEQIFTPFFTTKPVGVGTGLGLAICHRLVTGLGGTITVESELGRGTTFRVSFPAAPRSRPTTMPSLPVVPEKAARRGDVLVVDDEPMITYAVRHMLKQEHDITTVNEATAALELIRQGRRFDVILSDLMMPQMTGMDLFDELTRIAPDQSAKMVFLTGGAFTPRAREFLEKTPNQRIEKPFDTPNLRALVNACLPPKA